MNLLYRFASRSPSRTKVRNGVRPYTSQALESNKVVQDLGLSISDYGDDLLGNKEAVHRGTKSNLPVLPVEAQEVTSPSEFEETWREFQRLKTSGKMREGARVGEITNFMTILQKSAASEDAERVLAIFHVLPRHHRQPLHYRLAIKSLLRLNEVIRAVNLHSKAALRLRTGPIRTEDIQEIGTASLLRYFILEHENWPMAVQVYGDYLANNHDQTSLKYNQFWDQLQELSLPALYSKAEAITASAIKYAEDCGLVKSRGYRLFAALIVRQAFKSRRGTCDVQRHYSLFQKTKLLKDIGGREYNNAIKQLLVIRDQEHDGAALALYREMRRDNVMPTRNLLDWLLATICNIHSPKQLKIILHDYRQHFGILNKDISRLVIRELARQGDATETHRLFEEYREYYPDETIPPAMYHALLVVHFRRGELDHVLENFEFISSGLGVTPDTACWDMLIAAHFKAGDVDGAQSLFNDLQANGLQPGLETFEIMIGMHCSRGDLTATEAFIKEAKQRGIPNSISIITNQVLALIKNDMFDEAERIAVSALSMNIDGSRTRMWNYLLNAFALQANLEQAFRIHQRMRDLNVTFDDMTYAALLQALVVKKQPYQAFKILRVVMPKEKIRPSPIHYAIVMSGFIKTGEYRRVFQLYNRAKKRSIQPSLSTKGLLLKATTQLDLEENSRPGLDGKDMSLGHAEDLLDEIVENIDPAEIAKREPYKFIGADPVDEAYGSACFEYVIYMYGRLGALDKVSGIWNKYLNASKNWRPGQDVNPSIPMLSALMITHNKNFEHGEVERWWDLALTKAERLARRANVSDILSPGWVLHSRRYLLNRPLLEYMTALSRQQKIDELVATVERLQHAGFALDNKAWNRYVQILSETGRAPEAFRLCEEKLMGNWPGWESLEARHGERMKESIRKLYPETRREHKLIVMYETLVYLASAYMDARSQAAFPQPGQKKPVDLKAIAPRTVEAVMDLPRIDDDMQNLKLRRV